MNELQNKLNQLVKAHPKTYKNAKLQKGDLGYSVCVLKDNKKYGYTEMAFHFMDYAAMWNVLHYALYPVKYV